MSHYYFPDKFEFNRAYFNKKEIVPETKDILDAMVNDWFSVNTNLKFHDYSLAGWIYKNTIEKINPDYEHGEFYYYYLNQYVYEIGNAIWLLEYNHSKSKSNGGNEKVWNRDADAKREEFNKWMKENWR